MYADSGSLHIFPGVVVHLSQAAKRCPVLKLSPRPSKVVRRDSAGKANGLEITAAATLGHTDACWGCIIRAAVLSADAPEPQPPPSRVPSHGINFPVTP